MKLREAVNHTSLLSDNVTIARTSVMQRAGFPDFLKYLLKHRMGYFSANKPEKQRSATYDCIAMRSITSGIHSVKQDVM